MNILNIRIFLLLFVLIPQLSRSQDLMENEAALVTDRPDQTESSSTIPLRHLQIESGFIFEKVSPEETNTYYNATLLRFGLLKGFEIRVGMDYAQNKINDSISDEWITTSGFSPLSVGGKIQVTHEKGWIPR